MYQSLTFTATKVPTPVELHCLVAHLTTKADISVKVSSAGRVVTVVSNPGAIEGKDVALDTVGFNFKRKGSVAPYTAQAGDVASISVALCYTINRRPAPGAKNVTESPFDGYGRIKPHCRDHFLQYLERATGLNGLVAETASFEVLPHAMPAESDKLSKVWMTGACDVLIEAVVGDATVFNSLAGRAIGNRRHYGYGAVVVNQVVPGAGESNVDTELTEEEEPATVA